MEYSGGGRLNIGEVTIGIMAEICPSVVSTTNGHDIQQVVELPDECSVRQQAICQAIQHVVSVGDGIAIRIGQGINPPG